MKIVRILFGYGLLEINGKYIKVLNLIPHFSQLRSPLSYSQMKSLEREIDRLSGTYELKDCKQDSANTTWY